MPEIPGVLRPEFIDPARPQGGIGLFRVIWQRKSLVAFGVVIGLGLAALYYAKRPPVYQSTAQLLVVKKNPNEVTGGTIGLSYFEDYIATQQVLIRSPLIAERAINLGRIGLLQDFRGLPGADQTQALVTSLSVSRTLKEAGGSNNILTVSFRGPVSEDCHVVLEDVIASYTKFLDEKYKDISDDTLKLIHKAKDDLENRLAQQQAKYKEFREKAPVIPRAADGSYLSPQGLTELKAERTALRVRRNKLRAELTSLQNALKAGSSRETLLAMVSESSAKTARESSPASQPSFTAEQQLLALMVEDKKVREDYGPEHPRRIALQEQMDLLRKLHRQPGMAWGGSAASAQPSPPEDPVELYVQFLKRELDRLDLSEQGLGELLKDEEAKAKELSRYEGEEQTLRGDIVRSQQFIDGIIKRLQETGLLRDYGGYTACIIAEPRAGRKVEPNAFTVFPALSLLGLMGGLGLAYLAEVSDKRFRTPEEIRGRLGLPVVGHIPWLAQDSAASDLADADLPQVDPSLCTVFRPQSAEAEAFRGVRTSLYFSTLGKGHQVIQVTSPNPGDGKTTLVSNLAVSIAQSGKRVLLVDADLRKPRLHKLFRLSNELGLATVITGDVDLSDAIQHTAVPNLSLLPAGPVPFNPAELLTSPAFAATLDFVRRHMTQYDFVLIDTPPLLAVTDPSVVAPHVDGILLIIRIDGRGRVGAERAKEVLDSLGVTTLGVVVNGRDGQGRNGYNYGRYRYDYYSYADGYPSQRKDPSGRPATREDGVGAAGEDGTASPAAGAPAAELERPARAPRQATSGKSPPWPFRWFGRERS